MGTSRFFSLLTVIFTFPEGISFALATRMTITKIRIINKKTTTLVKMVIPPELINNTFIVYPVFLF